MPFIQVVSSVQVCLPALGLLMAQPWASFLWEGGIPGYFACVLTPVISAFPDTVRES